MDTPIHIPDDDSINHAYLSDGVRDAILKHRKDLFDALRQTPAFLSAVQKLATDGNHYRVLVTKGNLHLLREGADGIVKPWLRNASGQFVENVDLVRVPPDIAGSLTTLAIQAALSEISVKLDALTRGVENLASLMAQTTIGGLSGALTALEVAGKLTDDQERRHAVLVECGNVLKALGQVAGQMKAHILQMPSPDTDIWTGWNGTGLDNAQKAYALVREDFAIIGEALRHVVASYFQLGEFSAADIAFTKICSQITDAGIKVAAEHARLLPYPKKGPGPERPFESFIEWMPVVQARLRSLASGENPALEFDFYAEELSS